MSTGGSYESGKGGGRKLRSQIGHHLQKHDSKNKDQGIGVDYPYNHSPVTVSDKDSTSLGGSRHNIRCQPCRKHVFLVDEEISIFDLFSLNYAFIDFSRDGKMAKIFEVAAKSLAIPSRLFFCRTRRTYKTSGVEQRSSFNLTIMLRCAHLLTLTQR